MSLYLDIKANNNYIHRLAVQNIGNGKYKFIVYQKKEPNVEEKVLYVSSGGKKGQFTESWLAQDCGIIENKGECRGVELGIKMLRKYKKEFKDKIKKECEIV